MSQNAPALAVLVLLCTSGLARSEEPSVPQMRNSYQDMGTGAAQSRNTVPSAANLMSVYSVSNGQNAHRPEARTYRNSLPEYESRPTYVSQPQTTRVQAVPSYGSSQPAMGGSDSLGKNPGFGFGSANQMIPPVAATRWTKPYNLSSPRIEDPMATVGRVNSHPLIPTRDDPSNKIPIYVIRPPKPGTPSPTMVNMALLPPEHINPQIIRILKTLRIPQGRVPLVVLAGPITPLKVEAHGGADSGFNAMEFAPGGGDQPMRTVGVPNDLSIKGWGGEAVKQEILIRRQRPISFPYLESPRQRWPPSPQDAVGYYLPVVGETPVEQRNFPRAETVTAQGYYLPTGTTAGQRSGNVPITAEGPTAQRPEYLRSTQDPRIPLQPGQYSIQYGAQPPYGFPNPPNFASRGSVPEVQNQTEVISEITKLTLPQYRIPPYPRNVSGYVNAIPDQLYPVQRSPDQPNIITRIEKIKLRIPGSQPQMGFPRYAQSPNEFAPQEGERPQYYSVNNPNDPRKTPLGKTQFPQYADEPGGGVTIRKPSSDQLIGLGPEKFSMPGGEAELRRRPEIDSRIQIPAQPYGGPQPKYPQNPSTNVNGLMYYPEGSPYLLPVTPLNVPSDGRIPDYQKGDDNQPQLRQMPGFVSNIHKVIVTERPLSSPYQTYTTFPGNTPQEPRGGFRPGFSPQHPTGDGQPEVRPRSDTLTNTDKIRMPQQPFLEAQENPYGPLEQPKGMGPTPDIASRTGRILQRPHEQAQPIYPQTPSGQGTIFYPDTIQRPFGQIASPQTQPFDPKYPSMSMEPQKPPLVSNLERVHITELQRPQNYPQFPSTYTGEPSQYPRRDPGQLPPGQVPGDPKQPMNLIEDQIRQRPDVLANVERFSILQPQQKYPQFPSTMSKPLDYPEPQQSIPAGMRFPSHPQNFPSGQQERREGPYPLFPTSERVTATPTQPKYVPEPTLKPQFGTYGQEVPLSGPRHDTVVEMEKLYVPKEQRVKPQPGYLPYPPTGTDGQVYRPGTLERQPQGPTKIFPGYLEQPLSDPTKKYTPENPEVIPQSGPVSPGYYPEKVVGPSYPQQQPWSPTDEYFPGSRQPQRRPIVTHVNSLNQPKSQPVEMEAIHIMEKPLPGIIKEFPGGEQPSLITRQLPGTRPVPRVDEIVVQGRSPQYPSYGPNNTPQQYTDQQPQWSPKGPAPTDYPRSSPQLPATFSEPSPQSPKNGTQQPRFDDQPPRFSAMSDQPEHVVPRQPSSDGQRPKIIPLTGVTGTPLEADDLRTHQMYPERVVPGTTWQPQSDGKSVLPGTTWQPQPDGKRPLPMLGVTSQIESVNVPVQQKPYDDVHPQSPGPHQRPSTYPQQLPTTQQPLADGDRTPSYPNQRPTSDDRTQGPVLGPGIDTITPTKLPGSRPEPGKYAQYPKNVHETLSPEVLGRIERFQVPERAQVTPLLAEYPQYRPREETMPMSGPQNEPLSRPSSNIGVESYVVPGQTVREPGARYPQYPSGNERKPGEYPVIPGQRPQRPINDRIVAEAGELPVNRPTTYFTESAPISTIPSFPKMGTPYDNVRSPTDTPRRVTAEAETVVLPGTSQLVPQYPQRPSFYKDPRFPDRQLQYPTGREVLPVDAMPVSRYPMADNGLPIKQPQPEIQMRVERLEVTKTPKVDERLLQYPQPIPSSSQYYPDSSQRVPSVQGVQISPSTEKLPIEPYGRRPSGILQFEPYSVLAGTPDRPADSVQPYATPYPVGTSSVPTDPSRPLQGQPLDPSKYPHGTPTGYYPDGSEPKHLQKPSAHAYQVPGLAETLPIEPYGRRPSGAPQFEPYILSPGARPADGVQPYATPYPVGTSSVPPDPSKPHQGRPQPSSNVLGTVPDGGQPPIDYYGVTTSQPSTKGPYMTSPNGEPLPLPVPLLPAVEQVTVSSTIYRGGQPETVTPTTLHPISLGTERSVPKGPVSGGDAERQPKPSSDSQAPQSLNDAPVLRPPPLEKFQPADVPKKSPDGDKSSVNSLDFPHSIDGNKPPLSPTDGKGPLVPDGSQMTTSETPVAVTGDGKPIQSTQVPQDTSSGAPSHVITDTTTPITPLEPGTFTIIQDPSQTIINPLLPESQITRIFPVTKPTFYTDKDGQRFVSLKLLTGPNPSPTGTHPQDPTDPSQQPKTTDLVIPIGLDVTDLNSPQTGTQPHPMLKGIPISNVQVFDAQYIIKVIQSCNCSNLKFLIPILKRPQSAIIVANSDRPGISS